MLTALSQLIKGKQLYLRISLAYLAERLFGIALSFLVFTAIARTYGPVLTGAYSYVQAVMWFAVPFLSVGAESIVIRELVRAARSRNEIIGSAFGVLSISGLTMTLLPLGALYLIQGSDHLLIAMALYTALGFVPTGFLVIEQVFKSEQRVFPIFLARAGSAMLGAAAKIYLIVFHFPIEYVVLATAVEAFILAALLICLYQRENFIGNWKFNYSYAIKIMSQSAPGMVASVTVMLFFRANYILIAYFLGYDAVGQYAVAFQCAQLFLVLPHVFFGAVYPRLVYLHMHDPHRYRLILNMCYLGFTVAGYLIVVFCALFARKIFHLTFGDRYEPASQITIILAIANIFNFSWTVRGRSIDLANSTQYHMWSAGIGLAIVVATGWLVIPSYGAVGAAWCIAFALFVSGVVTTFFLPAIRQDAIVQLKALFFLPSFKMSEI